MSMYDYEKDIKESCKLLSELEGSLVKRILINIVDPEYNVVYISTDKGVFAIQGQIGGEYLGIVAIEELPELTNQEDYMICTHPPFTQFESCRIIQVRQIGSAWNGHGFEFSFKGVFDKTMIIQSIYSGDKPESLEDCLRLGVASYSNELKET